MAGDDVHEARLDRLEDEFSENRKVVTEQGQTIAVVAASLNKIESYMKESIELQREQAVLMERFTNHEEANATEHQHLHNRMDKLELRCDTIELSHKTACDVVKPLAEKGASVHKILVRTAWGIGSMVGLMLFAMVIWFIQEAKYHM